ncbi:MAG: VCBS repeat-containing protein [Lewinellaceae bacterium]|nr:VCBS repeat-containing protein [Lewinellaceae bacterium]
MKTLNHAIGIMLVLLSAATASAQPSRLYGLCRDGGDHNLGTLVKIQSDNSAFSATHHFAGGATDGRNPSGRVLQYSNKIFGLCSGGGPTDNGVLFEFDPATNAVSVKHAFDGAGGAGPKGGLVECFGDLWGMTESGGANGVGVLFRYDPFGEYGQMVYELNENTDGAYPVGSLLALGNKLYGLTFSGGPIGYGTLFEFDIWTNTFTVLHHFNEWDGKNQRGSLVEKDGVLYGMCSGGGIYGNGLIFSYHPMYDIYDVLHHFDGTDGGAPDGDLLVVGDKLYGLTPAGGNFNSGVLFEFDLLTYSYNMLYEFNGGIGAAPNGSLLEVDGKLYGLTQAGGSSDAGVIFEFDPAFNQIALMREFDGTLGAHPEYARFEFGPPCQNYSIDGYGLPAACLMPAAALMKVNAIYGGIPPFQYSSNDGLSYQSNALFLNPAPGNYTFKVKDADGCLSDPLPITVGPVPADNTAPFIVCRDATIMLPKDCSPVSLEVETVLDPEKPVFYASGQNLGNQQAVAVALGDLDGDGDLDAFMLNRVYESHEIWFNNGAGLFSNSGQSLWSIDFQSTGRNLALGDLDGDGDLDAFVVNGEGSHPNHVWFNNGAGFFTDSGQRLGGSNSMTVALGDVDGDGDLDACVGNDGAPNAANQVWLNNGSGAFTNSGQNLGNYRTRGLVLGDLDGDGDLDLFEANFDGQADRVYRNNGAGVFTDSGQLLGTSDGIDADLGDLDGDGDLDVFVTNWFQSNSVWLNNGAGVFSASGQLFGSGAQDAAALGDLDNDGDLDAFVTKTSPSNTTTVWLNDGAGSFTSSGQTFSNSFNFNLALGDVDSDGDLDALLAVYGANVLWVNALGDAMGDDCTSLANLSASLDLTQFDQTQLGTHAVTLTVTDNASNPAQCTVQVTVQNASGGTNGCPPEISILGNGVTIANRSLNVSASDNTDFGPVSVAAGTATHTFTIENAVNRDALQLDGASLVSIAGRDQADFSISQPAIGSINGGGNTTFDITFDPSAPGLRTAIVIITHNDLPENPFVFTVSGVGQ